MRAKVHSYRGRKPAKYGAKVIAQCGDHVPNVVPLYTGEVEGIDLNLLTCSKCKKLKTVRSSKPMYFSLIASGEEAKQENAQ